jgi:hypothetical protein
MTDDELKSLCRRYLAGGPGPKLTLIVLAGLMGKAHDETTGEHWWECAPYRLDLATFTEQDERTVRRHVEAFAEAGILAREPRFRADGGQMPTALVMRDSHLAALHAGAMTPPLGTTPTPLGTPELLRALQTLKLSLKPLRRPPPLGVTPTPRPRHRPPVVVILSSRPCVR